MVKSIIMDSQYYSLNISVIVFKTKKQTTKQKLKNKKHTKAFINSKTYLPKPMNLSRIGRVGIDLVNVERV